MWGLPTAHNRVQSAHGASTSGSPLPSARTPHRRRTSMRHLQATNQAALEALLSSNGVDTSILVRNTSKSVGDLWQETDAGESRLVANGAFGQLERHVEIVSVTLTRYVYPSIFLCYLHHHVPPNSDSLTHQNTPLSTPPPPPPSTPPAIRTVFIHKISFMHA